MPEELPDDDDARKRAMVAALRATADLIEAGLPATRHACRPALRLVPGGDTCPDPGPPGLPLTA
jgi:hypothetical protein